jgi:membrane-bound ClpP family serine protease
MFHTLLRLRSFRLPLALAALFSGASLFATNTPERVEAAVAAPRVWPENPTVFIIPVDQPIDKPQLFLFRRAIKRAREAEVDAIILRMDTPGGSVDIMRQIVSLLIDIDIPTYTWSKRTPSPPAPSSPWPPTTFT